MGMSPLQLSPFTTGYAAAGGSLFSQVMAGFIANSGTASEDISPSRRTLVSRARMLDISCPMATAAVDRMVHGVLGDGLTYSIGNSDFFDRDEYKALCGGLKKSLALASLTHALDIQGRLTFAQIQRMACRNWLLSGDVFFVRRPNVANCAWRIIESDRCMTPKMFNTLLSGIKAENPETGNTIIDGVELDSEARPVAYWFLNHYDDDLAIRSEDWQRIEAYDDLGLPVVLHLFQPLRPDQYRGVPLVANTIETLYSTKAYSTAELQAAIIEACLAIFIVSNTDPTRNPFGNAPSLDLDEPLVPETEKEKDEKEKDEEKFKLQATSNPRYPWSNNDFETIGPGESKRLADGEDIRTIDPKRPNSGYASFISAQNKSIAAAIGIPQQVLEATFEGTSYAAARGAVIEASATYKVVRGFFIESFLKPLFEVFAYDYLIRNGIETEFDTPTAAKILSCESVWNAPSALCLDPKTELESWKLAIEMGLVDADEAALAVYGHPAKAPNKLNEVQHETV